MTLLEMGGADDQGFSDGRSEEPAPGGAVAVGFGVIATGRGVAAGGFGLVAGGFEVAAEGSDEAADGFGLVTGVFDGVGEGFVRGEADRVAVPGEDDPDGADGADRAVDRVGDGAVPDEPGEAGDREGCTGMPIAGASACMPIRLLPMAIARIAPTTETGQPRPRSRRPRRPDWSTKTGAGAGSSKPGSDISGCACRADPRSMEGMTERTLRGLSGQGT
ncbi:hypothetical protein OHA37_33785 [Streptomyces sp. NBC_00335]|uniref:hypothetical protein n=1 Tax=unclassified Streptomyces TaxID=2593676 RepID=UPI0022515CE3|nr:MULTISPECIES: hypothetical protein [unclassified Streptomyces]MCX5408814.1 hypothetical protein [Streptomyces sp. NBC_00086]